MFFLREDISSVLRLPYLAVSCLCKSEDLWAFPVHFSVSIVVIHVQLKFGQSCCWDFMGATLALLEDTTSLQSPWPSDFNKFSIISSTISLRWGSGFIGIPWDMCAIVLPFDCMCFSVVVSHCCKDKFPWWGVRTTLFCAYSTDIQIAVSDYAGFVK